MDYLESYYGEKKPSILKRIFSKQLLLFIAAYAVYFVVSWLQLYAGDFILQDSGELDSVTSYDYVIPAINSAATVVILGTFILAGYFAYESNKIKMLRFPMAYCFSVVIGSFTSVLFSALLSTPFIADSQNLANLTELSSVAVVAFGCISALLFFFYFDREKEDDSYYDDYYNEGAPKKSLREKILSHRFSVLWTVLIISLGTDIISSLLRSGLTALIVTVPDNLIWISQYVEVVSDIVTYGLYLLLGWYFTKNIRTSVKLLGVIVVVTNAMNGFSFIFNSITNVFSQAGEHLLNSIFSTIFVNIAAFIVSVIKLIIIVTICSKMKKSKEYYY